MPSPTITLVTVTPNPAVVGQSVTVTATVIPLGTGTPTGTVTFTVAGATPPTQTVNLTGNTASATFTNLGVGVHTVTATYNGDANFTSSTGFNSVIVIQGQTTTTVVSSPDPSQLGQTVNITATVTPIAPASGTPTGTVTFVITGVGGGTFVQPVTGSGQATLSINTLGVGTHAITAIYSGDTSFLPSAGSDTQTVTPGPSATTTTVVSLPNPSVVGQPVNFTATVTSNTPGSGTPTGTVTFTIGGTGGGSFTQPLVGGVATLTTSTLGPGSHTVSAVYNPDTPNFTTSTGNTTQVVNKANTLTAGNAFQTGAGSPISFVGFVQPVPPGVGTPTGTVTFTLSQGTTTVFSGSAPLDPSGFAFLPNGTTQSAGAYTLVTSYSGDANFNPSSDNRPITII
ncbi:Ig-like domain-containing protein [Streptomyces sparsogenes]|uniref:Ig-like domain-containing protein n=1 Tax=Streptomyces sparsogenes TaxID=67365 RepID=UPI003324652D